MNDAHISDTPIAIHVSNVSKQYPGQRDGTFALSDISFDVPIGKIVCLLGPNGSGKTTLLKILSGLVEPTAGTVSILGHDMKTDPLFCRSQIGWMPAEERSTFYGRITGRQNLDFFAALHNVSHADLDRVVGNLALQIGLGDELDRMMLRTSGGARQKVALARALVHSPSALILDEPMRNLDPHAVMRFRRLIRDHLVRKTKKTVLLSTHQLEEARKIADHILIIKDGKVIKSLDAKQLEAETKNKTLEEFYLKTVEVAN
jgi:ABC-2 type transport system ATP-binding protein